ncbi:putative Bardet-Biedl syndrome 5 [Toxoplasma gondii RUB]|uniref:Putative Bardet-Biedl syndrome 5 n=2 Tax=Toxoplasma gondii TaxID=5811 RepID=A0A086M8N8_TOXGO|nr:putative Bardet-Biedl syndrome 5 [Toxoplasma gondii RUB]KFH10812.1 putative Bardet-Biedl syndrome 5 [Toxoplasma gondii VAND]
MGACMSAIESFWQSSLDGGNSPGGGPLWQDRQIRWDQPKQRLLLRPGEVLRKQFDKVEDTKGDNGIGVLQITNLRVIWYCLYVPRLNISIGLHCVTYLHYSMAESSTFGKARALHLMSRFNSTRFEFSFAIRADHAYILFKEMEDAIQSYRATIIYKDLLLRDGRVVTDAGEIEILEGERIVKFVESCHSLTENSAYPGKMYVTNYRILWVSNQTPFMNISLPYVQMKHVLSRYSQHGTAMVVESQPTAGGYCLAFRIQPVASDSAKQHEREPSLSPHQQLSALISTVNKCFHDIRARPCFGPVDDDRKTEQDNFVIVVSGGPAPPAVPSAVPTPPSAIVDNAALPVSRQAPPGASHMLESDVPVLLSTDVGTSVPERGAAGREHLLEELRGEPGEHERRQLDSGVRFGSGRNGGEVEQPQEERERRRCLLEADVAPESMEREMEEVVDRSRNLPVEQEAQRTTPAPPDEPCVEPQLIELLVGEGPGMPELAPGGSPAPPGGPSRPVRSMGRFPFSSFSSPSNAPSASSQARAGPAPSPPSSSLAVPLPEGDTCNISSSSPRLRTPGLSPRARGGTVPAIFPASPSQGREAPSSGPEETAGPETSEVRRGVATDGPSPTPADGASASGLAVPLDLTKKDQRADPLAPSARTLALLSPSSAKYMTAPKCVICLSSPDEAAFDPCGHVCTCMRCAFQIENCPICRSQILKVLRIYLTA